MKNNRLGGDLSSMNIEICEDLWLVFSAWCCMSDLPLFYRQALPDLGGVGMNAFLKFLV